MLKGAERDREQEEPGREGRPDAVGAEEEVGGTAGDEGGEEEGAYDVAVDSLDGGGVGRAEISARAGRGGGGGHV